MPKTEIKKPADYIEPLYMNGLHGRMLCVPGKPGKNREILLVYGLHASLERMVGVAEDLRQYGTVTLPDLPGFGGMESFYKIGEKPTLDNMADYLASFIKLRYKRRRITIVGMSFGFVVATRMLQKHPDLAKKVDILVSMVGFAHRDDFRAKKSTFFIMRLLALVFSRAIPSWFAQTFVLRGPVIRATYRLVADRHVKLHDADKEERDRRIEFEIYLWKCNHLRTYMFTTLTMLNLDLCNERVHVPVYHVVVEPDRYFDNKIVEQHLKVIFDECHLIKSKMSGHAPTVVADAAAAAPYFPPKIRRLLNSSK